MRLIDLAIFYLLLGAAACALVARRGKRAPADLALTLLLWPLIAPVALSSSDPDASRPHQPSEPPEFRALCGALADVRDPRLAAILPTRDQLRPLAARLAELDLKLGELQKILTRDEFAGPIEPELQASMERLSALRAEAAREKEELLALCRRLRAQITVLRFSGASAGDVGSLVSELLGRVEGAQAALDPSA